MSHQIPKNSISRKEFLHLAGAGLGSLVLASCRGKSAEPTLVPDTPLHETLELPQYLLPSPPAIIEDFESGWEVVSDCTIADDTTHVVTGTKSLQVTNTVAGTSGVINKPVSLDLSSYGSFRLAAWCEDYMSKFGGIHIYFLTNTGNYYDLAIGRYPGRYWTVFEFPKASFAETGSPSWSNITEIRIRVKCQSGASLIVSLDRLTGGPQQANGAVMIGFDDGYESVYNTAYPIMSAVNMRGTAFVVTDRIGTAGYMTSSELLELDAAGWCIGNHTSNHSFLNTLSLADQKTTLLNGKNALDALGLTRASDIVAYPYGVINTDTLAAMAELGFRLGRTPDTNYRDYLPLANNYLSGCVPIGYPTALATVQSYVDTIILEKSICSYTFHRIVESPNHINEWSISNFQGLIDYIINSGLYCLTFLDLYNLQSGSVTIPKPGSQIKVQRSLAHSISTPRIRLGKPNL